MLRRNRPVSDRKGVFDPNDSTRVKHTRLGVWDVYEEKPEPKALSIPGASIIEKHAEVLKSLPYVLRMIKDVTSIPACKLLLPIYFALELAKASMPAVALWYQGQLLEIMQVAIDTRSVNKDRLFYICAARVACTIARRLIEYASERVQTSLMWRIRAWYDAHIFRARARLDLPTYETTALQRQLDEVTPAGYFVPPVAWETLQMMSGFLRAGTQAGSQVWVLYRALRAQRDGLLLAGLTLTSHTLEWLSRVGHLIGRPQVWAATTSNKDYLKLHGWLRAVKDVKHRKELVAGNLAEYAVNEFETASERVGDADADFKNWQFYGATGRNNLSFRSLLQYPLRELPQIVFTLRAVRYPASMPISLASLQMMQETTNSFAYNLFELMHSSQTFASQLAQVRKLYEVAEVPNKVQDGTIPFPEDASQIRSGIALEFRNVSFRYPGSENYALRNISFSIRPGQLCIIVGANGSGKSTILKLIVRLYDPEEGQILLNGLDIRTLRLKDLRQAISVLFQDYTHFPLSIRDNIAIGDPSAAADDEHVRLAARLGGAEEFIEKLPEGFDTYLERPVQDYYTGLPEGTTTLFGRKVDYSALRAFGGMKPTASSVLSGGQMQRLAVARTFMRSVVPEDAKVGLLLFDEPSASLDPVAEHDLFNRLRELRGNKTMLFSSHRFGNLTRHADLILYMNDSVILETGTHEELLKQDGGYANIWKLQAQAFI
ncbi:P-loop containing nucleoside triphosphate hydrolase protein [Trametes cingulata]|nr:P-loop containing nucleoside triphosphate hydrolase protein [Trametes cingulata]